MTKIEWTDETWNPIVGCSVVSPGCTNCYAMRMAGTRLKSTKPYSGLTQDTKAGPVWTGEVRFLEERLTQPLKWRKPRRVFVNSMGDLFHEDVPDEWIDRVFAVMALTPQHTYQALTKRPERMAEYIAPYERRHAVNAASLADQGRVAIATQRHGMVPMYWPLPHVWFGTSVEDQRRADERIPALLDTPATVRFLSCEPLLGPIDLTALDCGNWTWNVLRGRGKDTPATAEFFGTDGQPHKILDGRHIDWVIVGGESGPKAREMDPDWARSLRDQCREAGVAFFMKQMTGKAPIPDDLMVREFPA